MVSMLGGFAVGAAAQTPAADAEAAGSAAAEELAQAPAADTAADADTSAGTEATILAPITVTATRNPIKAFEYPGMVTVVGREEIELRQASTPDDILQFVPNVEFTGGPRRTGEVPSIRSFDGPDVVVLFDGARQNFGSAHDGRFFLDPTVVKQAEVLRGSASALYGSGGTGGVIEFRTIDAADMLRPDETAGFTASVGYQTANRERYGTVTAYAAPLDGLDLVGSFTTRESGSIELGDGNELLNADDDLISGLVKGSVGFAEHHAIEASFLRFDNDAQEPNNGQADDDDIVDKEIVSDTYRLGYSYKNPDDSLLDVDLVAYYTDFTADELRLDDNGAGPAGQLLKRDVDTVGLRLDNRSRFSFSDGIRTTFTYGGEYYRDKQDGAAGDGERGGVPDADADFYGIFGQFEIALTEPFGVIPGDLLIIPGLRYDSYESDSDIAEGIEEDQLSPRIGVSYLPTDWSLLFVNYGEAFRAPTFDELFLTGTHFQLGLGVVNRFVPNPDLKPQKTETLEFGAGLTFDDLAVPGDLFQIKASHFRIWGKDFIDQVVVQPRPFAPCNPILAPGSCDGTTTTFNVPNAELRGTEVEASYENARALVSLGFSAIDGEDEDTDRKLGVLTPVQVTLNSALKLPEFDSILGWRVLLASDFENVNSAAERRSSYIVNDVYFAWEPSDGLLDGLRLDLGVDNLFDEEYARVFTDVLEPGRNFKARVSYSLVW